MAFLTLTLAVLPLSFGAPVVSEPASSNHGLRVGSVTPWDLASRARVVFFGIARNELMDTDEQFTPMSVVVEAPVFGPIDASNLVEIRPGAKPHLRFAAGKRSRPTQLFVIGEGGELLAIIEHEQERWARAIATARHPSRNLSRDELHWGWLVFEHPDARRTLERTLAERSLSGRIPLRLAELVLRYGDGLAWLRRVAKRSDLDPAELDLVRIVIRDVDPQVRACAAHLLLDHGVELDASAWADMLGLLHASDRNLPLLGVLLRLDDEAARAELRARLAPVGPDGRGNRHCSSDALMQAQYGQPSLLPEIIPFLERGNPVALSSWVRVGGGLDDLVATLEPDRYVPILSALEASRGREALPLILRGLRTVESAPIRFRYFRHLDRFIDGTSPENRRGWSAALDTVQPLDAEEERKILAAKLRLGDRQAFERFERSDYEARCALAAALVDGGYEERVAVIVNLIAESFTRKEQSYCSTGWVHPAIRIARNLDNLDATDRRRALERLDGEADARGIPESELVLVRWKLGAPPAFGDLPSIGKHDSSSWLPDEFDFDGQRERYSPVLPLLRQNVKANWYVLGLLRDEGAVPHLGGWLLDAGGDRSASGALKALRMIGSPTGTRYLFDVLGDAPVTMRPEVFRTLGELADRSQVERIAEMDVPRARDLPGLATAVGLAIGLD